MKFPFFPSGPSTKAREREGSPRFTELDVLPAEATQGSRNALDEAWVDADNWPPAFAPAPGPWPAPRASKGEAEPIFVGLQPEDPAVPAAPDPFADQRGPATQVSTSASVPNARVEATRSAAPISADPSPAPKGTNMDAGRPSGRREPPRNDTDAIAPRGSIGAILVAARRISAEDASRVVATQVETSSPFGETAIRLGVATEADIQFALSQQFSMPWLQDGDANIDAEVVAAFDPGHVLVESLRNLRGQIVLRALDATPALRSIAIMGAERSVGRSYIAANLATVFAQLGARTLLIDADLVNPRQHRLFKLGNRSGLSSILAGRADLDAVCQVPGLPGFAVLPAGPTPPNPHDLIARPLFRSFLRRCEVDFDIILIDTPAWSEGSSARMAAAAAGAAVMLVQAGRTAAGEASELSREIANLGTRLIGVVLNRPKKGRRGEPTPPRSR
jgi:chain length determinant protein tyrosine kinase EpsG